MIRPSSSCLCLASDQDPYPGCRCPLADHSTFPFLYFSPSCPATTTQLDHPFDLSHLVTTLSHYLIVPSRLPFVHRGQPLILLRRFSPVLHLGCFYRHRPQGVALAPRRRRAPPDPPLFHLLGFIVPARRPLLREAGAESSSQAFLLVLPRSLTLSNINRYFNK